MKTLVTCGSEFIGLHIADISKIKRIGYKPKIKFKDGLKELINSEE